MFGAWHAHAEGVDMKKAEGSEENVWHCYGSLES